MKGKRKTKDIALGGGRYIVAAPIVVRDFIKKSGQATTRKEFYLQRSVQDYFIKFCESKVSEQELRKHLSDENKINVLKLEIEYREGLWDSCNDSEPVQSRVGEYVVLHRIGDGKR